MNKYLERISLDTTNFGTHIPTKNYFFWYIGPSTKYFAFRGNNGHPNIGKFGGSFGGRGRLNELNKIYRKLKDKKMELVYLIKTEDPKSHDVHYNKQVTIKTNSMGRILETKEEDISKIETLSDIRLTCYLIDLQTSKVINFQRILFPYENITPTDIGEKLESKLFPPVYYEDKNNIGEKLESKLFPPGYNGDKNNISTKNKLTSEQIHNLIDELKCSFTFQ
jgi:hypothetical protein